MQTIKQLFEQCQSGSPEARDGALSQHVHQRLSDHHYTHKFSLWKKLALHKILDYPIVDSVEKDRADVAQLIKTVPDARPWDATLVFVNGCWSEAHSVVPKGLHVEVQEISQVTSWVSFLDDMPDYEISSALALSMASQSVSVSISQSMRVRFCYVATTGGVHAMNLHVNVASGMDVHCAGDLCVKTDHPVAMLCNRDLSLAHDANFVEDYFNCLESNIAWLCCQRVQAYHDAQYQFQQTATGSGVVRFYHQSHLLEERVRCAYHGLSLGEAAGRFDQTLLVKHLASHTESSQVFKHVARDRSLTNYTSRVYVSKDIRAVASSQTNHNLILDATARALTSPELEIYSDEVQCAHGATVGALDARALYYLRTRGLSEAQAGALLVEGFIQSMVDMFPKVSRAAAATIAKHYLEKIIFSV